MNLTRIFAKATIAAGLGIAALGAASGVAHSAPPSPDLSATVWAQGGWGWGHHGWGPGWGGGPWYWGAPPPPPPPWGYPGYAGWGGGWGC
ncbi:hypothetical protein OKHIL_73710 [Mycolicibacterium mageritense]|nr:hypothetical protein MTY414_70430 [Mycolicibacterium mageritense]